MRRTIAGLKGPVKTNDKASLLRAVQKRAARFYEHKQAKEFEKKEQTQENRFKKHLEKRKSLEYYIEQQIRSFRKLPSRIAVRELSKIAASPDTPSLQRARVSAILLQWTTGELGYVRRKRSQG